jgi:hypothetical protein
MERWFADGHTDHGATVDRGGANLVGGLEVRVQTPVGVDAGVEDQAKVERSGQDAIEKAPAKSGELFQTLFVPK